MILTTPRGRMLSGASLALIGALSLSACSSSPNTDEASSATADLSVGASFYALDYVASQVGGDHVDVLELTSPGVEPHDLELSPAMARELQNQDIVLYLSDFQPAVDAAIDATGVPSLDVANAVDLHPAEEHHDEDGHDEAEHEEGHDHDHGINDPHFWLDPALLAQYATSLGQEFATIDPDNATAYAANTTELVDELLALDESFVSGLASCERDEIFVTHEAFGYMADRYGLHQEGLSGVDPEAEPSPARVREIRDLMAAEGATTIFTETLVSADVAEALAADAGVATAVLDPIEGVMGEDDYVSVMNRNLEALRGTLGCS